MSAKCQFPSCTSEKIHYPAAPRNKAPDLRPAFIVLVEPYHGQSELVWHSYQRVWRHFDPLAVKPHSIFSIFHKVRSSAALARKLQYVSDPSITNQRVKGTSSGRTFSAKKFWNSYDGDWGVAVPTGFTEPRKAGFGRKWASITPGKDYSFCHDVSPLCLDCRPRNSISLCRWTNKLMRGI